MDAVEEDGAPAFGMLRDGGASGVASARDAGRADAELMDVGLDAEPAPAWDAAPPRVGDAARIPPDSTPGWDAFVTAPNVDALVLDDPLEAHLAEVHRPCRAAEPVVLDACATRGGSTPYRFEWTATPADGFSDADCRVSAWLDAAGDEVGVRVTDAVGRTSTASVPVVERAHDDREPVCRRRTVALDAACCAAVPSLEAVDVDACTDIADAEADRVEICGVGVHTVAWALGHEGGGGCVCEQQVLGRDARAPEISLPARVAVRPDPDRGCDWAVSLEAEATDNCGLQRVGWWFLGEETEGLGFEALFDTPGLRIAAFMATDAAFNVTVREVEIDARPATTPCVAVESMVLEPDRLLVDGSWRPDACAPADPVSDGFALRVSGRTFEVPPGVMEALEPGVCRFGDVRPVQMGPVDLWGDPVEAFAREQRPDAGLPADSVRPCEPERLNLRINGIQLPSVVGQPVERGVCARSALALVDALNAISVETGVRAEAGETIRAGNAAISGGTLDAVSHIVINGETITGVVVSPDDADGRLLDAVNSLRARTGVRAALDAAGGVQLRAPGLNIDLVINGVAGTITGMGADTSADLTTAPLRLFSDGPFRVEGDADLIGFAPGWYDADGRTNLTQWSATVRPLDGRLSVEAVGAFEPGAPSVEWVLGGEPWRACEDPDAP